MKETSNSTRFEFPLGYGDVDYFFIKTEINYEP